MDASTFLSALAGFAFVAGSVEDFWRDRRRSPVGAEGLVGKRARVLPAERDGAAPAWVVVGGERWRASASFPLVAGGSVRIEEVRGLELRVVEAGAAHDAIDPPRPRLRRTWLPGLALWGVAVVAATLGGGSPGSALASGPLVVLLCYGVVALLAIDAG